MRRITVTCADFSIYRRLASSTKGKRCALLLFRERATIVAPAASTPRAWKTALAIWSPAIVTDDRLLIDLPMGGFSQMGS